jgi:hypothetical protein
MTNRSIALVGLLLALAGLTSCQRAQSAGPSAANAGAPANATVNAAPPAPAPAMEMVCRNSQTGAKAECGSPGAVMVGMKPESGGNTASPSN